MALSAIFIDKDGKSEVVANPANLGSVPKDFMSILALYTLCDIDFDKGHPGGNTAQKIDALTKSNKDKWAEIQRLKKLIEDIDAKYNDAKLQAASKAGEKKCKETFEKDYKEINEKTGKYAGINDADKQKARDKAKDDRDACEKKVKEDFEAGKKLLKTGREQDKDIKAAEAALKVISIPDLPIICDTTAACAKGCEICTIVFINNEDIVVKKFSPSPNFDANQLYFCSCTVFERDHYKLKNGKIEKVVVGKDGG